MLDPSWPPPATGPQQPRDAHAAMWRNDTRARGADAPLPPDVTWWPDLTGEAASRRRGDARAVERGERGEHDGPWHAGRPAGDREPSRVRRSFPGARWVPAEAWIPQPSPAPEQRWTPEQDWLSAFSDRAAADLVPAAPPRRAALRRWAPVLAVAVPLAMVLAAVVALLA
ncbi:hypothetical protein [Cellulomonas sp. B6]|uniref:hypothetical protein n=1 Tax=Cellulomonas sp. B6 TaxID=1295626 RepID=UPI00073B89EE|nr:hypothetical protein [Cellulomonas sp. B6]KSW29294.1 hypothetical protein ATM99_08585 [Cellulomonas sp. B6]